MIVFFGEFEIILMIVLIIACIAMGVETIGKLLPIIFVVVLIKNLLQDIVFAMLKNRKNFFLSLLYLAIDLIRMALLFYTANLCVKGYSVGGLAYFDGILSMLIYLLVGGLTFVMAELYSVLHGMEDDTKVSKVLLGDFCFLILLFVYYLFWTL